MKIRLSGNIYHAWDLISLTRTLGLIRWRLLSWKLEGKKKHKGVLRGSEWPDMSHGIMARVAVTHVRCIIAILYNTLLWAY